MKKRKFSAGEVHAFASAYTKAWCSQDASRVATFFAEDGALFVNGVPATGREAITAVVSEFMTAFPDMVLVMDDLEIKPDNVIFHWTFTGTHTGPGGTGNPVRFSGYEKWTRGETGLIDRSLGHFDKDEYEYQLQHGVRPVQQ